MELSFLSEKLDFPANLNYCNFMGTSGTKHKSNHSCPWIKKPYTHLKDNGKANSFMKPVSSSQPGESHFAQVMTYQIKELPKKKREKFLRTFSLNNVERESLVN